MESYRQHTLVVFEAVKVGHLSPALPNDGWKTELDGISLRHGTPLGRMLGMGCQSFTYGTLNVTPHNTSRKGFRGHHKERGRETSLRTLCSLKGTQRTTSSTPLDRSVT